MHVAHHRLVSTNHRTANLVQVSQQPLLVSNEFVIAPLEEVLDRASAGPLRNVLVVIGVENNLERIVGH